MSIVKIDSAEIWVEGFNRTPSVIIKDSIKYNPAAWHIFSYNYCWDEIGVHTPTKEEIERMDGYIWSFNRIIDDLWLMEDENKIFMIDMGFTIYSRDDVGYFFKFYDDYVDWEKLYNKRFLIK